MNGEVGALARSKHRKKPQSNKPDTKQFTVHMSQHFTRQLGHSIGADGHQLFIFFPGEMIINAIYTAARSKNKLFNVLCFCKIKEMLQPDYISLLVSQGVLDTGTDTCFSSYMYNYIYRFIYQASQFFCRSNRQVIV